jgi:hypothetical protein
MSRQAVPGAAKRIHPFIRSNPAKRHCALQHTQPAGRRWLCLVRFDEASIAEGGLPVRVNDQTVLPGG